MRTSDERSTLLSCKCAGLDSAAKDMKKFQSIGVKPGARVQIKTNHPTEALRRLGLVNGAEGIVVGIRLDRADPAGPHPAVPPAPPLIDAPVLLLAMADWKGRSFGPLHDGLSVIPLPFTIYVIICNKEHWTRYQFNIDLAWGSTIHCVQGKTILERIHLHLQDMGFGGPQMRYVALSRAEMDLISISGPLQLKWFLPDTKSASIRDLMVEWARLKRLDRVSCPIPSADDIAAQLGRAHVRTPITS